MPATDSNGRPIIPAGTLVTVRTTNGGELTAKLASNHYRTYDVVFDHCIIPGFRVVSVIVAPAPADPAEWTHKQACDAIRAVGCTLRRTAYGEWRVNFTGGAEATASYETSLADAVETARAMARS